ncbi:MAG: 5-bromo-4-chloroindolyl phosphate hydrolysis family protein [Christensenellales bacterium]
MSQTRKKTIKSSLPIYIAAAAFALFGIILPIYRLWALIVTLIITAAAYILSDRLVPKKIIEVPVEPEPVKTGDTTADGVIAQGQEAMKKLRELNEGIKDHLLTAQINRMEIACSSIFKAIAEKPSRSGQVRRFMNYYLPTSLKLLESYRQLTAVSTGQQNVETSRMRIRESMGMIADAFEKQLDNLYEDVAIDITTDIEVMESMLKSEGLK